RDDRIRGVWNLSEPSERGAPFVYQSGCRRRKPCDILRGQPGMGVRPRAGDPERCVMFADRDVANGEVFDGAGEEQGHDVRKRTEDRVAGEDENGLLAVMSSTGDMASLGK